MPDAPHWLHADAWRRWQQQAPVFHSKPSSLAAARSRPWSCWTAAPAKTEPILRRDRKPKCFAVTRAKHCGGPSLPPFVSGAGVRDSVATTRANDGGDDVAARFLQFV